MDIYCRFCGEPMDIGELDDIEGGRIAGTALFRAYGCGMHYTPPSPCTNDMVDKEKALAAQVVTDMLDDADDWAATE